MRSGVLGTVKKIASSVCFVGLGFGLVLGLGSGVLLAQTAEQAWLKDGQVPAGEVVPQTVRALGGGRLEKTAVEELRRGFGGTRGVKPDPSAGEIVVGTVGEVQSAYPALRLRGKDSTPEGYWLQGEKTDNGPRVIVAGADERGVLYGAFALRRMVAEGQPLEGLTQHSAPAFAVRWVNEWDNADGSIERGYGGRSIFFEGGKVRQDLTPVREYARLLASVGINGCNVNNVNSAAPFLDPEMLRGVARIADAMRPWGVRVALSVDVASPEKIGGLKTYDPLDPAVQAWWKAKADAIYALIPDFAGFTVKADSEGQPGPASYGRTPADAANTLAAALEPHGGVVLYRAFVYNHHLDWNDPKADRARAAYDIFHPLDGKFAANVIVQIKEGPIDFQVREPVSPLFGGLPRTQKAMEVQITQEYLGQQRHLVYLGTKWQWVLFQENLMSAAAKEANPEGSERLTGMVGVACVGRDGWLGSPLAMANLYAFGRLAWNPSIQMRATKIAEEWTRQTFGNDPDVVRVVDDILLQSWRTYERYTGPLGLQTLTDVTGSHYGPNVEASENNGWGQWHRADHEGVGMDRTVATGTGFAGQYPPEIARLYENPDSTVSGLLLFFHHLPYTYRLHNGKTVIQSIYDMHYLAAEEAAGFVKQWETLEGKVDAGLYKDVLGRLEYQAGHAIVWRDAVVEYFWKLSGIADEKGRAGNFPGRLEAEDAKLSGYQVIDVKPWEDASRGKAVTCAAAKKKAATHSCSAEWTYDGAPGVFDVAVDYFDLRGGAARFAVSVNGKPATSDAAWTADAQLPSTRPDGDNATRRVLHDVGLAPGDVIRVTGTPDGEDGAALDYVEVGKGRE